MTVKRKRKKLRGTSKERAIITINGKNVVFGDTCAWGVCAETDIITKVVLRNLKMSVGFDRSILTGDKPGLVEMKVGTFQEGTTPTLYKHVKLVKLNKKITGGGCQTDEWEFDVTKNDNGIERAIERLKCTA